MDLEFGVVEKSSDFEWKLFMKKHWRIAAVFVAAIILAVAGAVYVFLWFVGNAQSIGLVPSILGQWTMGHLVTFILHLVFWEIIFIGIPAIIGAVAGWQWWKRLPEDEKRGYHFGKRSRSTGGGGGVSLLFFVAFCIKVYVDGNWNIAIASWTLDYVVGSMITILVWTVIIFGIPAAIIGLFWLSREIKKKP